jgi:DNA-binding transcriptional regulator YiaG
MRLLINIGILLAFVSTTTFAYDVVLKNGKSIHGTKVSEDENQIVVQDASGIRINIKKSNVDTAKTENANQQTTATPALASTAAPSKPAASQKTEPKKPARKFTKEEIEKLREKYDLGQGTFGETSKEGSENGDESVVDNSSTEKTEAEWREEAEMHRQKLEKAEEQYNRLNEECGKLKQIAVQTHVLVDEQGNELPMQDTTKEVCDLAESAQEKLNE